MGNRSEDNCLNLTVVPILLSAEGTASILGISRSFLYSLHASGELGSFLEGREDDYFETVVHETTPGRRRDCNA